MKLPLISALVSRLQAAASPASGSLPPPKVKPGQATLPSYLTTAKPNTKSPLPLVDSQLVNRDLTTVRTGASTSAVIRDMVRSSPDLSAAVSIYARVAITSGYIATAHNWDKTINPEATAALHQMLTWLNVMTDPTIGYDDSQSLRSACETWTRELLIEGAAAGELVLNKVRLPDKLQPVGVNQIRFYPSADGKRRVPEQQLGGEKLSLDTPTFFMVYLDQDTNQAYPVSPLEPAQQAVLFSADFMQDVRRIVKKAIHPRVTITINEDKFVKTIPPEYLTDSAKLIEYRNSVIRGLEQQINGLQPEEALVLFDSVGVGVVDHGNTNLSNEYKVIQDMADAKMATGAKVLPTALGHASGTSNVASTEVVLFVKYVEGAVQEKLNELISKMLTLGVRLYGHDVYVSFAFNPIDLRPRSELEAFEAMKQSRVLDQLSLGLITDEMACVMLTGSLPPAGYKKLSGTMFRSGAGTATPTGDGYNGASNSGSTLNQNLKPDAPQAPKGKQKQPAG